MSQTVPPEVEGQESPNPIELFWEQHQRKVQISMVALAIVLAAFYGWKYLERQKVNEAWSELATAAGLDDGYADFRKGWTDVQNNRGQQFEQIYLNQYLQSAYAGLINKLDGDLANADVAALESIAGDKGDSRAPLAQWFLSRIAVVAEDWDAAKQRLNALKSDFPDHFLCLESDYPVQWRDEVEKEDDDEEEAKPNRKPELVDPTSGSAVSRALQAIEAQQAFRTAHSEMFQATAPTSEKTLVFVFDIAGDTREVKIKLFDKLAPQHAEKLMELAAEGTEWWKGVQVHEIRRPGDSVFSNDKVSAMTFGWASTKDETDRTKWSAGTVDENHEVEWEDTLSLSLFPGTVSVDMSGEKSQVERLTINATDAAAEDGRRVIIGRVVEGMDTIEEIVNLDFQDEQSATQGRGQPGESVVVTAVRVE